MSRSKSESRRPGKRAAARVSKPVVATPQARNRVLFEALENRLLLSADPLAALADGALHVQLTDAADSIVLQHAGMSADGGEIIDLQLGALTQRFGDADTGVKSILAQLGAGDDRIELMGILSHASIDGGGGSDTLASTGPGARNWDIDAANSGRVAGTEGSGVFSGIENLLGADDNEDTFSFSSMGSLDGLLDGGARGFDTLVISGGAYSVAAFTATGPDAGTVALDGNLIRYRGLEPIVMAGTLADAIFNLTGGDDDAVLETSGSSLRLRSVNASPTFELTDFAVPGNSLTIDGAGRPRPHQHRRRPDPARCGPDHPGRADRGRRLDRRQHHRRQRRRRHHAARIRQPDRRAVRRECERHLERRYLARRQDRGQRAGELRGDDHRTGRAGRAGGRHRCGRDRQRGDLRQHPDGERRPHAVRHCGAHGDRDCERHFVGRLGRCSGGHDHRLQQR